MRELAATGQTASPAVATRILLRRANERTRSVVGRDIVRRRSSAPDRAPPSRARRTSSLRGLSSAATGRFGANLLQVVVRHPLVRCTVGYLAKGLHRAVPITHLPGGRPLSEKGLIGKGSSVWARLGRGRGTHPPGPSPAAPWIAIAAASRSFHAANSANHARRGCSRGP